jgi:hypothetical protein
MLALQPTAYYHSFILNDFPESGDWLNYPI